jgi:hypothetical protein
MKDTHHNNTAIMFSVIMLSVYAECHGIYIITPSVVIPNVVVLSVGVLSIVAPFEKEEGSQ